MWHHHQVCAGPNSPLNQSLGTDGLNQSLQSYLDLGAAPEKLIVGIPWYGCE